MLWIREADVEIFIQSGFAREVQAEAQEPGVAVVTVGSPGRFAAKRQWLNEIGKAGLAFHGSIDKPGTGDTFEGIASDGTTVESCHCTFGFPAIPLVPWPNFEERRAYAENYSAVLRSATSMLQEPT